MNNLAIAYDEREDKRRVERINGEIIRLAAMPAVNHNRVVINITRLFTNFLNGKRCEAFADGVDVHFDTDNTFVPDVMIVCRKEIIKYDGIYGAPDLVVEVLSRSTAKRDRNEKKNIYEKYGVREYWLVNYTDKTIEVYLLRDGKLVLDNVYALFPDWEWDKLSPEEKQRQQLSVKVSLYDDFIVDLRDVFARVEYAAM